jgi:hypothetical protein
VQNSTLAFMFEVNATPRITSAALSSSCVDKDYHKCWQGLRNYFTGPKGPSATVAGRPAVEEAEKGGTDSVVQALRPNGHAAAHGARSDACAPLPTPAHTLSLNFSSPHVARSAHLLPVAAPKPAASIDGRRALPAIPEPRRRYHKRLASDPDTSGAASQVLKVGRTGPPSPSLWYVPALQCYLTTCYFLVPPPIAPLQCPKHPSLHLVLGTRVYCSPLLCNSYLTCLVPTCCNVVPFSLPTGLRDSSHECAKNILASNAPRVPCSPTARTRPVTCLYVCTYALVDIQAFMSPMLCVMGPPTHA